MTLKERIEEIVDDRISTRITDRGLSCKYCGVDGHRIKTCAIEITTDILKVVELDEKKIVNDITPKKSDGRLCPFMSRPEGDRLCEGSKCMAWGKWEEHGAYRNEIKKVGCFLIRGGK